MGKKKGKKKKKNQLEDELIDEMIEDFDERLDDYEEETEFTETYQQLEEIGRWLANHPLKLAGLRKRGFVHSGQLEKQLAAYLAQWEELEPRVEDVIADYQERLEIELDEADEEIEYADDYGEDDDIDSADEALDEVAALLETAESDLRKMYGELYDTLKAIDQKLEHVGWMLDQIDSSKFTLRDGEGPVAAVEAMWQRDGEEGPNGILFLTDQRLLFEQKEEVATKKLLGLFTTESERLHELLLDIPTHQVQKIEHSEEGGFLGLGKDDILNLTLTAEAPVSRARFHLQGQDSADWATWIKQAQNLEFDSDRAAHFAIDRAAAALAFPEKCPNCFAAVPKQPPGVTTISCEFCGGTIQAS